MSDLASRPVPRRIVFDVEPCPKPRMTQRDKWKVRPPVARYRAFADALRATAASQRFTPPDAGLALEFIVPMPASWSAKRRREMDGQPHQQKPDKDNFEKAFWDALLGDDSRVWHTAEVCKRWGERGCIVVTLPP